jgi:hypothetical protein
MLFSTYVYDILPMPLTLVRNVRNNTETDVVFISCTAYETTKSANSVNHMSEWTIRSGSVETYLHRVRGAIIRFLVEHTQWLSYVSLLFIGPKTM